MNLTLLRDVWSENCIGWTINYLTKLNCKFFLKPTFGNEHISSDITP